jgi:hypothetical protein
MMKLHAPRIDALRKALTDLEFQLEPDASHDTADADAVLNTLEVLGDKWVELDQEICAAYL